MYGVQSKPGPSKSGMAGKPRFLIFFRFFKGFFLVFLGYLGFLYEDRCRQTRKCDPKRLGLVLGWGKNKL